MIDFSEQNPEVVLNLVLTQLEQGDFQQRWEISKILPDLGTIALEPLLNILQDETTDVEMRWFVARILGQFKSELVVEPLINLLKTDKIEATEEELSLQEITAITLASLGTSAIKPLMELLQKEESKRLATFALAQIRHSEIITPLLTVVNDSNPEIRAIAIEALGSFHDPRVIPVLLEALNDPVGHVRKEAVIGLGVRIDLLDNINLVEKLKPLLWDIRPEVCQQAQLALSRLKTDEAATALFEQVQSSNVPLSLKIDGVRSLGWIETPQSLKFLEEIIFSFHPEFNLNAPSLTPVEITLIQEIIQGIGRIETLELREQAAQILIDLINRNHPAISDLKIKQLIAVGLGKLGLISALDPLIQLLADPQPSVRYHCISAFKQIKCEQTYQYLQHLLNQDNINLDIKQEILKALSEW
ncbi:HEAT repeat domain-containing protein [Planktothrix mougeotii]|uniref:HEAT repeat domain-containing protein n=1 Tax=Planktothrix mougeotii LEGE 06226 TaxID=1828728 RepID=A0ABR9UFR5_9CYAN|nr:HEAT repeat domain-containing protein [Planktothrix mougeotii]MBE9145307.1 HEAT repeat domain-containing protein [Planktothrix mougeotii LEGE 06226]